MALIKERLLWKLLLINVVPVIAVTILVIWLAIDKLAAGYFMALMKKYEISPLGRFYQTRPHPSRKKPGLLRRRQSHAQL